MVDIITISSFWKHWKTRIVSWAGIERGAHPVYYLFFILFLWYGNHAAVFFETKVPLNELFALLGFILFLWHPIIYRRDDYLYNCVMMILFVFFAHSLFSLFIYDNFYGYLRNLVLFYSVFSFFLGIKFYNVLEAIGKRDLLFLSALMPTGEFYRTSYAASLPFYFSRYFNTLTGRILAVMIFIVMVAKLYYGGASSVAIVLMLLFFSVINKKWWRISVFVGILLTITFFTYMKPYLYLLLEDTHRIDDIQRINSLFLVDENATTRFFLWSYLFFKVFINHPFGIGLGTVFIPHDFLWEDMRMWFRDDPYSEFTLGAHNSFVTIAVRFGIIGILPFIVLYWKLIKEFIKVKALNGDRRIYFFYASFAMISGTALLNVVLESPLLASFYWGILGILYQARKAIDPLGLNRR
jgi:O-antigen ligase